MRRRGVEMSLNLIILIVLALIVVVIILFMVTRNARAADSDFRSCYAKKGTCVSDPKECIGDATASTFFIKECEASGRGFCCINPFGEDR